MLPSTADEIPGGHPGREDEAPLMARFARFTLAIRSYRSESPRLVADALKETAAELRKGEEMRMSQCVSCQTLGVADIYVTLS